MHRRQQARTVAAMHAGAARRFWVVGTSGSGKSTLARRIAAVRDLPYVELDALHHLAGWQAAPTFRDDVAAALDSYDRSHDGWVVDGNYRSKVGDLLVSRCDLVVWLDYPRRVVMGRLFRRTARRVVRREELWNGNRESWRDLLNRSPENNILLWAWTTHTPNRSNYQRLAGDSSVPWVRLRSPRATTNWILGGCEVVGGSSGRNPAEP